MEQSEIKLLKDIADQQIKNSEAYAQARKEAGEAEADLKILLAPALKEMRKTKKNLGVEMAVLFFIAENEIARNLYEIWIKQEAIYKGLEKILDSYSAKLIMEQSIMKRLGSGERWGV